MWMFKLLPKEILNAKKTCGIKEEKKSILIFLGYKEIPEAQDWSSGLHLEQKEEKHKHKHELEDPKTKKYRKETQM